MLVKKSVIVPIVVLVLLAVTAVASSNVTFHIFRDNSVSISAIVTQNASPTSEGELLAALDIDENEFLITARGDIPAGGAHYETTMNISFNITQRKEGNAVNDVLDVKTVIGDVRGNKLTTIIRRCRIWLDLTNLTVAVKGRAELEAIGKARQTFMILAMIDKEVARQYLEAYNISGITINKLKTEISGDVATVDFDVIIDLKKIGKEPLQTNKIADLRALLAKFSYPMDVSLSLRAEERITFDLQVKVEEDINEVLDGIVGLYAFMKTYKTSCLCHTCRSQSAVAINCLRF